MRHFSEEDLVDFVRGVARPELASMLERHLDSGCKKCLKSIALWRSILDIARDEADSPPPESAVRGAEACYGLYGRPEAATSRVPTLAELVFDSFRQPVPAGARSSATSGRQLLYKSEGIDVDIRTHFDADSNQVFLTGQVLDPCKPNADMKGISVMVVEKSGALGQTVTNGLGEFQLEFDNVENVWLRLDIRKQRTIIMVIRDLESKKKLIPEQLPGI